MGAPWQTPQAFLEKRKTPPMTKVTIKASASETVGEVNRFIFGSFVEHMGRCVYGGVFDPSDPMADEDGFRKDVIELTKELGVTMVRYPGGNLFPATSGRTVLGPRKTDPPGSI